MKRLMGLLIIMVMGTGLYYTSANETGEVMVVLESEREGQVFFERPVSAGDIYELSWIHSVEKTPWAERYAVTDGDAFLLERTEFASYGAGVPHEANEVRTENGMIIYDGINTLHDDLRWIHSHQAEHALYINGEQAFPPSAIPHQTAVRLYIEWRSSE
ncbi:DUF1850 domain-containing protein [Salisediminibacterium selenitireducens]|uniref:DUF1850 domain-containing protein n=1 Tax=Bacillus selenitireducens (strain ATCC 700615 / DSM 15326 / MLS10) TaxID=439292 RepID=D6XXB6_BACIE|nr:DUF1850 domain-containing protein [Salisediminibacterium selenitireducens]ADH97973.1 Domain of unknown function DUF1850 [[Bacillus] selenitireducens MLS10]